ncbi:MAG: RNase P modulator RnpM [Anaerolineae bacterium]
MTKKKQPRPKRVPQRTCVACRQKTDKRRLTRIVRTPEREIVIDPTGKQNGRGAYVCDREACWNKILSNRALLGKALKTEMTDADLATIAAHKGQAVTASAEGKPTPSCTT